MLNISDNITKSLGSRALAYPCFNYQLSSFCFLLDQFAPFHHRPSTRTHLKNNSFLYHTNRSAFLVSEYIISPPVSFYHYQFANDNKTFLILPNGDVYHDAHAYTSFYSSLSVPQDYIEVSSPPSSAISFTILARQQYGHYLYDDVLPLLGHILRNSIESAVIHLYYSLEWQYNTLHQLIDLLKKDITLIPHMIPLATYNLTIPTPFLLPQYPITSADWSVLFPWKLPTHDAGIKSFVYISRQGFDLNQRVIRNFKFLETLQAYGVKILYPERLSLSVLIQELSNARVVIADPGTTPLIAGIFTPRNVPIIVLQSSRTLSMATSEYCYSGWRYHLPWASQFSYLWCKAVDQAPNPFSDQVEIATPYLLALMNALAKDI